MIGLFAFTAALAATPGSGEAKWQSHTPAQSRAVLRQFANCVVMLEPKLARRFVLMPASERMPEPEFRRLFDGRCLGFLGGELRMRPWASRGALAEALIAKDVRRPAASAIAAAAPLAWTSAPLVPPHDTPAARALDESELLVSRLGECTVRADPAGAYAAIRAKADSREEAQRMAALAPRIAGCVSAGNTLEFHRANLRTAMALAYYRLWSQAQSVVAATPRGRSR